MIQHEEKLGQARRPQKRVVVEPSPRATIRDREGIPLAVNKVQYNAAILYSRIREVPRWVWKRDEKGKRVKFFKRKHHIADLANLLGTELQMDAEAIEDLIHAKAAIFGRIPFVIKENISEEQYFRLKMLERELPGIYAQISPKRCYPLGQVGGEVVGYMGSITKERYDSITLQLKKLQTSIFEWEEGEEHPLPEGYHTIEEVKKKLKELEAKAYTINDKVGKAGIERSFDEDLRGMRGKKVYLADIRGRYLRELPGSERSIPGTGLKLTISAELQQYAEELLGAYEAEPKIVVGDIPEHQPWIKGGGIVVMEPNTGEILALATSPRFDPRDFTDGEQKIEKWLEQRNYIASIWNGEDVLSKEYFSNGFKTLSLSFDLQAYLALILPPTSPVRQKLIAMRTIKEAAHLQILMDDLLAIFGTRAAKVLDFLYREKGHEVTKVMMTLQEQEELTNCFDVNKKKIESLLLKLHPYFNTLYSNYEKVLLTDLCRMLIDSTKFSPHLLELVGDKSLFAYKEDCQNFHSLSKAVRSLSENHFDADLFKQWKEKNFKAYLKEKREEEKEKKQWARPYTDYLARAKEILFEQFWEEVKWESMAFLLTGDLRFLKGETLASYKQILLIWRRELHGGAHQKLNWVSAYFSLSEWFKSYDSTLVIPYLKSLRSYRELNRPLLGTYTGMKTEDGVGREKDLAASFYPPYGFGFARSWAFRQATTIGSLFKLVPAYEALLERYQVIGGRGFDQLNPLTIIDDKRRVSNKLGGWEIGKTIDGRPIPIYYRGGRLPRSDHAGIGKIDLISALESSSNPYFSLLAGDVIEDPDNLLEAASKFSFGSKTGIDLPGEFGGSLPADVVYNRTGLYAFAIGQHSLVGTPLQAAVMLSAIGNGGFVLKPKIVRELVRPTMCEKMPLEVRKKILLPSPIRTALLRGMRQVIWGEKGTARNVRFLFNEGNLIHQVVGKTSTAESMEHFGLDGKSGYLKVKHIWFGAISFDPNIPLLPGEEHLYTQEFGKPELVVVVYLRYGMYGNKVAPLALNLIKKWRELKPTTPL
ncbi:MAG: hypothetical protein KDK55_02720 [Chlamydiia bacterium]|nr:hypothetical protein [Chlamydiia bacterium]